MRTLALAAAILCAASLAHAQVSVEILLDQEQYLREESVPIKVRITNRSGQPLALGKEADWLTFTIERDKHVISRSSDMDLSGEFSLDSAFAATRTVDLIPYYDLHPGRYSVSATVKMKDWKQEFSSKGKFFEVVRGTKVWEQEFGVAVANAAPEVRRYVLQQAQYQKRLMLYLRVTDADERHVFRVTPVGPLVSFSKPEVQVDGTSHLHLLFQTGARSFRYAVYGPSGDVVIRQTHDYANTRPVLRGTDSGKIYVAGGMRRLMTDDIPPFAAVAATSTTNEVSVSKP